MTSHSFDIYTWWNNRGTNKLDYSLYCCPPLLHHKVITIHKSCITNMWLTHTIVHEMMDHLHLHLFKTIERTCSSSQFGNQRNIYQNNIIRGRAIFIQEWSNEYFSLIFFPLIQKSITHILKVNILDENTGSTPPNPYYPDSCPKKTKPKKKKS